VPGYSARHPLLLPVGYPGDDELVVLEGEGSVAEAPPLRGREHALVVTVRLLFPVDDGARATSAGWHGWRPLTVAEEFGTGFCDLTAFTLQMAMVVLCGHVIATSPPVAGEIARVATYPSTPRGSVAFVARLSCLMSIPNRTNARIAGGVKGVATLPDSKRLRLDMVTTRS
jgi:hypothetical protein